MFTGLKSEVQAKDPPAYLNVFIKFTNGLPAPNSQVSLKLNGVNIDKVVSGGDGWAVFNMTGQSSGTYFIEAKYPLPPNDDRSGNINYYYSSGNQYTEITLNIFY